MEWYPCVEYNKKALKSWSRSDGKELLNESCLFGSKYKDAFYCKCCDKVVGIFHIRKER